MINQINQTKQRPRRECTWCTFALFCGIFDIPVSCEYQLRAQFELCKGRPNLTPSSPLPQTSPSELLTDNITYVEVLQGSISSSIVIPSAASQSSLKITETVMEARRELVFFLIPRNKENDFTVEPKYSCFLAMNRRYDIFSYPT